MFARTIRAICGTYNIPIAKTIDGSEFPKVKTKIAAKAIPGKDINTSMILIITSPIHFRVTAAIEPIIEPKIKAKTVAPRPMTNE